MKEISLFAALTLTALVPAHASGTDTDRMMSGKTRAEVQAELLQSRADGTADVWKETFHPYNAIVIAAERSTRLAARPAVATSAVAAVAAGTR